MNIFPAIDLYDKKAVRLYKGNYNEMTVYSEHPERVAEYFKSSGAEFIHTVDLEGARDGNTPNIETVKKIIKTSGLKVQIGGGVSYDFCFSHFGKPTFQIADFIISCGFQFVYLRMRM